VGHVRLPVTDVAVAERWLESVGLRPIFADASLAVLELRGGTHVVVRKAEQPPASGSAAPFDLMVTISRQLGAIMRRKASDPPK